MYATKSLELSLIMTTPMMLIIENLQIHFVSRVTPKYGHIHKLKNQISPQKTLDKTENGPYSMWKLLLLHSIAFGVIIEDLRPSWRVLVKMAIS